MKFLIIFSVLVVAISCGNNKCQCDCDCDFSTGGSGGFTVSGNKIIDSNGKVFLMRGINHAHSWFKNDIEGAVASIAGTGANTIRIVLANGKRWPKDEVESVRKIIEICEKHKLVIILEVHDGTGSENIQDMEDIVTYWKELKGIITGKEDRIIVNIANEWIGTYESYNWAEGSKYAIRELRNAGFEHLIIIDTAGWGQYSQAIWEKGQEVFQADSLGRTVFSIHMYESAGGSPDNIRNAIEKASQMPFPVIIGEFGDRVPHQTPNDVDTILSYSQEKQIGWIAWSWYGNNPPEDCLDMSRGPSNGYALTEFGHKIVDSPHGIRATSTRASVYN